MKQELKIIRGTTNFLEVTILDAYNNPYKLVSDEVVIFGMKRRWDDWDEEEYLIKKTVNSMTDGKVIFRLNPEDTIDLRCGKYFYDIGLHSQDNYFNVIPCSEFVLLPNITERGV